MRMYLRLPTIHTDEMVLLCLQCKKEEHGWIWQVVSLQRCKQIDFCYFYPASSATHQYLINITKWWIRRLRKSSLWKAALSFSLECQRRLNLESTCNVGIQKRISEELRWFLQDYTTYTIQLWAKALGMCLRGNICLIHTILRYLCFQNFGMDMEVFSAILLTD